MSAEPKKLVCEHCGDEFVLPANYPGRTPKYCSNACKQAAYRMRKKYGTDTPKISNDQIFLRELLAINLEKLTPLEAQLMNKLALKWRTTKLYALTQQE